MQAQRRGNIAQHTGLLMGNVMTNLWLLGGNHVFGGNRKTISSKKSGDSNALSHCGTDPSVLNTLMGTGIGPPNTIFEWRRTPIKQGDGKSLIENHGCRNQLPNIVQWWHHKRLRIPPQLASSPYPVVSVVIPCLFGVGLPGDAEGNQSDTTDQWDLSNFTGGEVGPLVTTKSCGSVKIIRRKGPDLIL